MPLRSSMASLVGRVRALVADPTAADADFTDQVIQDQLDRTRIDITLSEYFQAVPTYNGFSGGQVSWLDYYAPAGWGDWEDDLTLWWGGITQLTPSASDNLVGHWTFAVSTPPPVYLVGKSYDQYAAAYELCLQAAATAARQFDVSITRGTYMNRSQKYDHWRDLADLYARQRKIRRAPLVRADSYAWT